MSSNHSNHSITRRPLAALLVLVGCTLAPGCGTTGAVDVNDSQPSLGVASRERRDDASKRRPNLGRADRSGPVSKGRDLPDSERRVDTTLYGPLGHARPDAYSQLYVSGNGYRRLGRTAM